MIRFGKIVCRWAGGIGLRGRPPGRALCKILIYIVLAGILFGGSVSLAQGSSKGPPPPRPNASTNVLPWFLAFILLGLGCAPAFKSSKRELER